MILHVLTDPDRRGGFGRLSRLVTEIGYGVEIRGELSDGAPGKETTAPGYRPEECFQLETWRLGLLPTHETLQPTGVLDRLLDRLGIRAA